MFHLLAPFVIGFLGSFHCLGMCGPLVAAYGLNLRTPPHPDGVSPVRPWQSGILHHLAFHSGRLLTYGFLGILVSGLAHVIDTRLVSTGLRMAVTLTAGSLMVLSGLALLRIVPLPFPGARPGSLLHRRLHSLVRSQRLSAKIGLGIFAGFLPCMLSWSLVIQAAASGDTLHGFLTMVLFGLGTVPALFLLGFSTSMLSMKVRLLGERGAALSVIFMGLILIFKGVRAIV